MRIITNSNSVMEATEIRYEEVEAKYPIKITVKPSSCLGEESEYLVLLKDKDDSLSVVTEILDNALLSGFVNLTNFPLGIITKTM